MAQKDQRRAYASMDCTTNSTHLLDLPLECLDQIFGDVVAYDEESEFNLRDATRLLRVSSECPPITLNRFTP